MPNRETNYERHHNRTSHNNADRGTVRRNMGIEAQRTMGINKTPQKPVKRHRTTQNDASRKHQILHRYTDTGSWNINDDELDSFDSDYQMQHGMAGTSYRSDSGNRREATNRYSRNRRKQQVLSRQTEPIVDEAVRQSKRGTGRKRFIAIVPLMLVAILCGYDILMTGLFDAQSTAKGGSVTVPADDIINMAKAAIPEPEPDDSIDWASLLRRNNEVKAWMDLQVGNVGIHEPVVQPSTVEGNSYYLKHDLDRRSTYIGNIFYDMRDSDDGTSRLAYGHHFTGSTKMLSSINDAYNQSKFDMMQPMRWRQPDGTDDIYVPVMSMKVYKTYQKCQSFTAKTPLETQELLQSMASDAQAKSPNFDNIINSAEKCITFVTCASNVPNQPWRTLVVFAKMPSNN